MHLYVHVPFCPTLCPYCDFHVVRRQGGVVAAYLKRLAEEAQALYARFPGPLETLYLGGGTPSFLRAGELEALFQALPWDLSQAEVTLEANPGTLNPERLALLRALGVNRLSLGVQSFQEAVLKALGRAHGRKGALRAVELSLEAGFRTSVDLILGLPQQDVEADLKEVAALGVGHVSAYTLQVEPGTPLALSGYSPEPELEALALERAVEVLGQAGLRRYEVSNFARPGQESRHNLAYWRNAFWGALGPSAVGQYPAPPYALRLTHPPLPRWLAKEAPAPEPIPPLEHVRESLMLGLRLAEGVDLSELEARTKLALQAPLGPALAELAQGGGLALSGSRIRATNLSTLHPVILRLWEALEEAYPAQKNTQP
ncbi:coproporphyrinogen III oxidase family protein [Meiothermus sp. QL-1]|uniref:radical SAM family heme chaperone HemW n=1 Tax=Meiothermus sp. QL-1 TaxID=2058095 RepID=UPI000E0C804D|nr:radical SAM family heme chaperone HemW [Meiothermus sp. QL-1]RDI96103.1 coproporphyrinogen III oxidase family protein [Meiothermus sp. QL-1]